MSDNDIAAIERLRAHDEAASLAGDFATLRDLVSDDAVVIPPGGDIIVGKAQIDRLFATSAATPPRYRTIEYNLAFGAPELIGRHAIEFGAIIGATRDLAGGSLTRSRCNALRVLRKEGANWRVYRTVWTPVVEVKE